MKIVNAQIISTALGPGASDYRGFCFWVYVKFELAEQGFGGFLSKDLKIHLSKLLSTVGVGTWEQLPGKFLRIEHDNSRIYRVGNIIENEWYSPEETEKEIQQ